MPANLFNNQDKNNQINNFNKNLKITYNIIYNIGIENPNKRQLSNYKINSKSIFYKYPNNNNIDNNRNSNSLFYIIVFILYPSWLKYCAPAVWPQRDNIIGKSKELIIKPLFIL